YVHQVKEKCLGAYAHQEVSFERVVEAVQPERQLNHHPVFQVMFSSEFDDEQHISLAEGMDMIPIELENKVSKFDLSIHVVEQKNSVKCELQYRLDLFGETMMNELADHWLSLLYGIVERFDQQVFHLPIHHVSVNTGDSAHPASSPLAQPEHMFFYDYIDQLAGRQSGAAAIVFDRTTVTYSELTTYASQIAGYLAERTYPAQSAIGVYMNKDWKVIPIVLGIMKAGHIFVPLDPQHPVQRTQYMMEDVDLQAVFVQQNHQLVGTKSMELLEVDSLWADMMAMDAVFVNTARQPEDKAYIIYTSGTTGKPKGIPINHRNLAYACPSWKKAYHTDKVKRYVQLASIAFDVFIQDMVRSLCSGGTLILCDRHTLINMPDLYQLLYSQQVQFGEFVPAVLKKLASYMKEQHKRLPELQLIVSGADTWYAKDFADLRHLFHEQVTFINSYGVTEVTVDNLYFELGPATVLEGEIVPIGRPLPHIRAYILDAHQQPVPHGVSGELYLGGPSVSQGYYRQPALTAEKFVSLPHIDEGLLYRTGDLVRCSFAGHMEFLGRRDYQVKIRGYRIEIGEIESIIRKTGLVRDVRVTAREVHSDKRLVAYLIPHSDSSGKLVHSELISILKNELPAYMVPYAIVELEQFPLNANGKVDAQALPEPDSSLREQSFVPPQNPFEELVAHIWQQVLQLERVGRHDHFFELGGHSLIAAQVASRLQQQLQMPIPLSLIFECPVLEQMAVRLEESVMQTLNAMSDEDAMNMLTH
uniref:non-ribosomal peptide synthetase n=1 Tax=Paenibacillus wulumuqiensis TaxID=1567107 RepID=UPI00061907BB